MWFKLLLIVTILNIVIALYVGDECTPNAKIPDGVCTVLDECSEAKRLLKRNSSHGFLRCGFTDGAEILCCPKIIDKFGVITTEVPRTTELRTTDKGVTTTEVPRTTELRTTDKGITTTEVSRKKEPRIADRECQKLVLSSYTPLRLNIIGGQVATLGEFPHMVAIAFFIDNQYEFKCGGSLISSTYVLTAAHCTRTSDRIEPEFVRIGVVALGSPEWNDKTDYRIASITHHPGHKTIQRYHDIALLRLEKQVPFNNYQGPACLYTGSEDPKSTLSVTGWGIIDTATKQKSNLLLKANVVIVGREICRPFFTKWHGLIDHQLCAGDPLGFNDTCEGDSGGPLQDKSYEDYTARIVGVTSFGRYCGDSTPSIYTRVSQYLDWIESIVWPN